MKIQEAQQTVDEWIKTVGVRYFNELTNTAILTEEVGELASLMARIYGEQSFKGKSDEDSAMESLEGEMADVLFVLICFLIICFLMFLFCFLLLLFFVLFCCFVVIFFRRLILKPLAC